MSVTKLKPCPCCGSDDIAVPYRPMYGISVECQKCGLRTPTLMSAQTAVRRWNRRADAMLRARNGGGK